MPNRVTSTVVFHGPIFNVAATRKIVAEETGKILDEAGLFGETAVKQQLFPTHGVITGFLRESVTGTRVDSLNTIIDAGEFTQGSNVIYARFIESLYNMFHNAWMLIRQKNLAELLAKRIANRLNG